MHFLSEPAAVTTFCSLWALPLSKPPALPNWSSYGENRQLVMMMMMMVIDDDQKVMINDRSVNAELIFLPCHPNIDSGYQHHALYRQQSKQS